MVSRTEPRDRDAYRHFTTLTTRWSDNDAYGHVNNVIYYAWFDSAVNQWLVEQGLLDFDSDGPIGLVVETGCRYFAPLRFPGDVEVGLAVERIGTTSVTYRLGIFAPGAEEAAAEGHFTHVYVERTARTPHPIPDSWRDTMRLLALPAS